MATTAPDPVHICPKTSSLSRRVHLFSGRFMPPTADDRLFHISNRESDIYLRRQTELKRHRSAVLSANQSLFLNCPVERSEFRSEDGRLFHNAVNAYAVTGFWEVAHGLPQAWAIGALAPPPEWKYCKVFCALVVTAKRSVDELFMHYFHNLSSASGGLNPRPHRGSISGPQWVTFVSRPLICQPLVKTCGRP